MSIGLLFWVLMILWFLSWMGATWGPQGYPYVHASNLLFFILLFLLGWHAFGFVIHA